MKRALVLVALVLAVVAPPPAPAHSEAVRPAQHSTGGGARPAAAVASLPEVVDDPCLPGDASCPPPVEAPAGAAHSVLPSPPASRAVHSTPSRGASAGGAHPGGPGQRPAAPPTVAAPADELEPFAPPATDSPRCEQLPGEMPCLDVP